MKRKNIFISILLTLLLVLVLTGCDNKTTKKRVDLNTNTNTTTTKSNNTSSSTDVTSIITNIITTVNSGYKVEGLPLGVSTNDSTTINLIKNYYSNLNLDYLIKNTGDTQKNTLKSFLKQTAKNLSKQKYDTLKTQLCSSDAVPGNTTKIRLFYSQDIVNAKWDSAKTWNREHVYAKSVGGYKESDTPSADLHDMRPTYTRVNSTRGNDPFGIVQNRNSYKVIADFGTTVSGYSNGGVFEPIDAVKGDVARIIFYISIMYYKEYSIDILKMTATKNVQLFLDWNREDPVDSYEIYRNNYIQGYQGNRNPFIDFPDLADYIW